MKFSCIFVITFLCTLCATKSSARVKDENLVIQVTDEGSRDIIEEKFEVNTLDLLRKRKKKKPVSIRNCLDLMKKGKKSGTYMITPCDDKPTKEVEVYCDMDTDGGGWTVLQRRDNYTQQEEFYNSWYEYAVGFGDPSRDFWLGNDNIHCLTDQSHAELRFDLEDFEGNSRYAKYSFFYVDDRSNLYKMSVEGNYTGDAGDSFSYHKGQNFSTYDADHDSHSSNNCANDADAGFWFNACRNACINGLYLRGNHSTHGNGVNWYAFKGSKYSLKKTEMKIRKK